jgi:hypothetical protein
VDTSAVGKQTGAWRVVLERSMLTNFAKAVGDNNRVYRADVVPAPPTFTFAAPYWSTLTAPEQPPDPTKGGGNPMHALMGDLYAKGALVLHGEQEFEYHRTPQSGDVLDGVQTITDVYEKETDSAHMTFIVMETSWTDAHDGSPVVTERFNLIARLKR